MADQQTGREASGAPAEWGGLGREERTPRRWWGLPAQTLTAATAAGLALIGIMLLPEGNTAPWDIGSCVSAQDSHQAAEVGENMVAVRCDQPNEGRIVGISSGARRCPAWTDYYVLSRSGDEVFCIANDSDQSALQSS